MRGAALKGKAEEPVCEAADDMKLDHGNVRMQW